MREFFEAFSGYLKAERGASQNTQEAYLRDLRNLAVFLEKTGIKKVEQVSPLELGGYLEELSEQGRSSATISRNTASIRAFFSWMRKEERLIVDPSVVLHPPKVVKHTPVILNEAEIEQLLAVPSLKTAKGLRDRAMLELMYATGLRVSELCGLQLSDAAQKHRMLVISSGNTRLVPYDRRSARWLEKYLRTGRIQLLESAGKAEKREDCGALFVNCQGEPMSRQGFWKLLKKYGRDAGIQAELTPHVLRHSFAVHALKTGTDVDKLMNILGHSAAATTSGYLEICREETQLQEENDRSLHFKN